METKQILRKIFGEIDTTTIERLTDETLESADGWLAESLARFNGNRTERGEKTLTMDEWIDMSLPLGDARRNAVDKCWKKIFIPGMREAYGEDVQQIGNRKVNFGAGMVDDGLADLRACLKVFASDPDVEAKIADLKRQATEAGYNPVWVWHRVTALYGALVADLLAE